MKITKVNCPKSKYNVKCPYEMIPEYITVHNTANDASAMSEVSYMLGNSNKTSFHTAVDHERAVQGIDYNRSAWHAGDGKNGKGNRKSIGIEICYSRSGGDRFIQAEKNAAQLIASLLKRYGWGIDKVKRHKDWSGKNCPHRTIDMGWERFLNMIKSHMSETTQTTTSKYTAGSYQTNCRLNVRKKATISSDIVTTLDKGSKQGVDRIDGNWGHLMNNAGWICLDYCSKITTSNTTIKSNKYTAGSYQVTANVLNVRSGAGIKYKKVATIKKGSKQGIDRVNGNWGHLMNNVGWICLDYCKKI